MQQIRCRSHLLSPYFTLIYVCNVFPLFVNYVSVTIHATTSWVKSHNTQLTYPIRMLFCIEWPLSDWYLYFTTVKKCDPVFFPVTGNMTCVDTLEPFSFGSQCNFTCQEGYYLSGDSMLTCLASGMWSYPMPTCTGGPQYICTELSWQET